MLGKNTFRLAALLLSMLLVLSTALVGCGSPSKEQKTNETPKQSDTDKTESTPKQGKPVEITYWFPHGNSRDKNALEKAVDIFNKANPDIKVTAEFVGASGSGQGITDKLTTAINGGSPPDVVLFDRFMVSQWASGGLFEDLTDLAQANGVTKDMFYDFAIKEASYKDRIYAMPFDTDCRVLYYNKKMFKEAGLDPEKPPLTIAELDEYAEKLTKKEGNRYKVIGFIPWLSQGWLYTWGWAFGGQFQDQSGKITANHPDIVKALEWETTYAKKYDIEAITNFSSASGGDINPFSAGMVAMMISGPWEIAGFKEFKDLDYGVSYIPTPTGSNFNSWAGGWCYVIPKGTKNKEASFKFAKFMSVEEGARIYGEDTVHFMSYKDLNDKFTWVKNEPKAKIFLELFPKSYCRPAISKGQLLWDELATATDNALHGKGTPKELLDKVTEKVNKELGF
ncbi:MAG: multiple sugar transport system substrate-binding protein [Petroclostridium sp.]|jgi:ABC-type glycerol-3-phosphate transport system substrate-binding protein|nr:transporter substrate-binding protein [Clostridia bacterium]MDK2809426.1 multiple sugar transport system substrate-binding protein [Petroclostridium sp.]